MSHGPIDNRVPDAEWATQEVKDIMIEAQISDKYRKTLTDERANQARENVYDWLRKSAGATVDQALAALEDAGYEIVAKVPDQQEEED